MVARIDDVSKSKKKWLNFHPLYALRPFINLETQHNGRSAQQIWIKKVNYFCVLVGGQKGFAREHQNGFYET